MRASNGPDRNLSRCPVCGEWAYRGKCAAEVVHPAIQSQKP